ncbi:hypothetical protein LPJ75_003520 [Coemansia sp. RSA 2598]|nr:hypothetical protein LPJ75_003520 [Coemansia sp. RSA 2598]
MNSDFRAAARVLCTAAAPNIVSEVVRDTLERWATQPHEQPVSAATSLLRLGQYAVTFRIRASREQVQRQQQYDRQQVRNVVDGAAHWVGSGLRSMLGTAGRRASVLSAADELAVQAMLKAAEDAADTGSGIWMALAALALVGGMAAGLRDEGIVGGAVERAALLFAGLVERSVVVAARETRGPSVPMLSALVMTVLVSPRGVALQRLAHTSAVIRGFVEQLFDSSADLFAGQSVVATMPEAIVGFLGQLLTAPGAPFADAQYVVRHVHAEAVEWLVASEQHGRQTTDDGRAQWLLHMLDPVLQRYYVQDYYLRVPMEQLMETLVQIIDTMALVHHTTLQAGREGTEVFRRTSTLAIQFLGTVASRQQVDRTVQLLFAEQKCLLYLPTVGIGAVGRERSFVVLFYLDLMEHLAGYLEQNTLRQLVLPLATLYAGHRALAMGATDWFESAHAVVLAVLEDPRQMTAAPGVAMEVVPWYSDLIMELYPDRGMGGELLRISYAACIRALAGLPLDEYPMAYEYIGDRLDRLKQRIDGERRRRDMSGEGASRVGREISGVRERELLLVLADQIAAVPLALLPALLADLHRRLANEQTSVATRESVATEIEETVLVKCDVARKPALSVWIWQLRNTLNAANTLINTKL